MLYWGLIEQAQHEHMSDDYKTQYIIDVTPSPSWAKVREHLSGSQRTETKGGQSSRQTLTSQIRII